MKNVPVSVSFSGRRKLSQASAEARSLAELDFYRIMEIRSSYLFLYSRVGSNWRVCPPGASPELQNPDAGLWGNAAPRYSLRFSGSAGG